ncbi:MAG: MogA/MoaB family molybdenum cofactor biosynthesis protein [Firmicutes bacterium]|nr:MogA/MoaB family molybdenum cofactor biosynthesis protein [Bacillota bacterium]
MHDATARKSIKYGILTASDSGSKGDREDLSSQVIREMVEGPPAGAARGVVAHYVIVADEAEVIAREISDMADNRGIDVILTTGGTGLSPRDHTPEATYAVIDREVPGIAEAMRQAGMRATPHAMLSRQVAGTRGQCLIVNMPGSPRAVKECLEVILPVIPHAVEVLRGQARDCARLGD